MNREQAGERKRKRAWWLGAVLGVLTAAFFSCTFPCFEPFYASLFPDLWSQRDPTVSRFDPPPQPFDQAKWQRGYATDRMAMGKWLASNGALVGLTRDQATAMLGPPDSESRYKGVTWMSWKLGRLDDNSLFARRGSFAIDIDDTGTVVTAGVWFDD